MKKLVMVVLLVGLTCSLLSAENGFQNRPITNNINIPTGFTLSQGEFQIGLGSIGYGISDRVQMGTNVLLYLFQIYNANLKVNVWESQKVMVSSGLSLYHFNPAAFDTESGFSSVSPYVSVSSQLSEKSVLHITGRYAFFSEGSDWENEDASSVFSGTSILAGLEYSLSNKTKFLSEGGYDSTFNGIRFGGAVLFGWNTFRLKLGVNYFKPDGSPGFTFPIIGLWWRFNG